MCPDQPADGGSADAEGRGHRVLFLTPQYPYPPEQGTALRNYGLARGIAERHAVTLLAFASDT